MELQAIKTERLYLKVAEQLRSLITTGDIAAGTRLPSERDLAEKLGVSRPTVREAMIALEIAGLVEIRSGSGVYATPDGASPDPIDPGAGPFEILQARRLVEAEVAALAASRIDAQQLQQLDACLKEMARENQSRDGHEAADERFHRLIATAAGNSVLTSTVKWLWRLRNDSQISQRFHSRLRQEGIRPVIKDHEAILRALRAGDAQAARDAMRDHLQRVIDDVIDSGIA